MNRILVISNGESDLTALLRRHCNVSVISSDSAAFNTCDFDSLCVLFGNESSPMHLSAPLRVRAGEMIAEGKPVFCEFISSIGATRTRGTVSTYRQRLVYLPSDNQIEGLYDGDLLNCQNNECIKYAPLGSGFTPIIAFRENLCGHYSVKLSDEERKTCLPALFNLNENTILSAVRLSNFRRARFSPESKWQAVISYIISFLAGEPVKVDFDPPVCTYVKSGVKECSDVDSAVRRGISWIYDADILKKDGTEGAHEGYSNSILAKNGLQQKNNNVRADCTCEIGGALLFDALITGNAKSKKVADALFKFAFDWLQVKGGEHHGMLRWSEVGWESCYQDDVARALLPLLLVQYFDEKVPHLEEILDALDYLVDTTGEDGIRSACTEMCNMTLEARENLKKAGSGVPSAHFNSYYHAVLLLAYRITGKEEYLRLAERGLTTLMSIYPNTQRETSETEECCRMLLPLAVLYGVSGKREHYEWLCRITEDLEKRRHPSGGYAEWDTGYKASCSRNHKGECALLADNGDPVADLLYSNNWLPLAFAYSYMVTGEERFLNMWKSVASFLVSAQVHSSEKTLDGSWARAFDMDTGECNGMPHDAGWGPCCIESGWTVGEILMGLQFIHIAEKKVNASKKPS